MSESNVELARTAIGSLERLFDLFDEEIVWDNSGYSAGREPALDHSGIAHGKPGVIRQVTSWVGTWEDFSFEVLDIIDAGENVVLEVRESGRGRTSGAPMTNHYWAIWTFREQRIVRGAVYATLADALQAAESSR
jgi:ketosteroid isomerase-like protein